MDEAPFQPLIELYRELDGQVAGHSPRCDASGRCCRFKEYGHTLFLSEWEAEYLFSAPVPEEAELSPDRCPFQVGNLCTARDRRGIGCRVYFCDPAFEETQYGLSEEFIRRLKQLNASTGRQWRYRPLHEFFALARTQVQSEHGKVRLPVIG